MKEFLFFISLLGLTLSFTSKKNIPIPKEESCNSILDSANILVETGEFTINWKPNKLDNEKQLRISKWFEGKSFSDLRCLLESNNKLYQFYGFMYASMFHKDSLKNNYSDLLDDTTSVQFSSDNGIVDAKMTLGKLLQEMCKQIVKDQDNMNKQPAIEKIVSEFIKEYASYPNTYKALSFPYFGMVSGNAGLTNFNIRHEYEIKNNRGQNIKVISAFILDPNLNINVIELDSSSFISSYPPKLKEWFKNYGRQLNHSDSLKLKLK